MLKVMLADDEAIIRNGMKKAIPWEELGLEFVGAAADGREALRMAIETKPNIIITDIAMPYLDGLEFVRELRKYDEDNYIIIVSGYDEFEYAKQCIKMGVVDYVLKPVDLDELIDLLRRIKEDYAGRLKNEQEMKELKKTLEDSCNEAVKNILLKLILNPCECSEEDLLKFHLDLDQYGVCIMLQLRELDILKSNSPTMDMNAYFGKFVQLLKGTIDEDNIKVYSNQKEAQVILLMIHKNKVILDNQIRYSLYKIRATLRAAGGYEYYCCVGRVYKGLKEIVHSYHDVQEMLDYSFVCSESKDLYYDEYERLKKVPGNDIVRKIVQTMGSLRIFDKKVIKKSLDSIEQMIRAGGVDCFTVTQIAIGTIYGEVIRVLGEYEYSIDDITGNSVDTYKRISNCCNLDETIKELFHFLCDVCDFIDKNKKDGIYNLIIERAKLYIKNNYSNPSLSLDEIAGTLNISPGYLSILFKQVSKQSFINYLTALRIEKAKELLVNSNLKTYEISYKVGYDNATYFSTIFKKNTGLTPKEYRESWTIRKRI